MKRYKLLLLVFFTAINVKSVEAQSLKPGDVHPNAKYLDLDDMEDFTYGAAIVRKGQSKALIDAKGNFLIHFNKYNFNSVTERYKGIILVDYGKSAVNTKGDLICQNLQLRFSEDDEHIFAYTREGFVVFNSSSQKFLVNSSLKGQYPSWLAEGLMAFEIHSLNSAKTEIKNLNNDVVFSSAIYDQVFPFSEGMALVAKRNEFGELKYGFISSDGKEAIPPMYSNLYSTEGFTCGRLRVYPKANADFKYVYINKKGEIIIKYTDELYNKYGDFKNRFFNGYTFNDRFVMDTSGKIISHEAFLAKYGVKKTDERELRLHPPNVDRRRWTNGQVITYQRVDLKNSSNNKTGFIDMEKNIVVEGPFSPSGRTGSSILFDPVSKLAYVEMNIGKNNSGGVIYRKGYINMQGIFMIIKKEDVKW